MKHVLKTYNPVIITKISEATFTNVLLGNMMLCRVF
jgi:hypothetical protein